MGREGCLALNRNRSRSDRLIKSPVRAKLRHKHRPAPPKIRAKQLANLKPTHHRNTAIPHSSYRVGSLRRNGCCTRTCNQRGATAFSRTGMALDSSARSRPALGVTGGGKILAIPDACRNCLRRVIHGHRLDCIWRSGGST